jgi:rare lipoprotein A
MSDPTMKVEGALQGKVSRHRTRIGVLAVTLGLSASLAASPTVKQDIAASPESHIDGNQKKAAAKHHWLQIGKASWYGGKFNGRSTANGETYDMYGLTCAHRTLPLGSWVRITNLKNRKSTVLRVNDRGPMAESLIVDLSYAAAQRLGIEGLAKVRLETIASSDPQIAEERLSLLQGNDASVLQGTSLPTGILAVAMPQG